MATIDTIVIMLQMLQRMDEQRQTHYKELQEQRQTDKKVLQEQRQAEERHRVDIW